MSKNGDPAPGLLSTQDQFAISFAKDEAINKVNIFLETRTETEARSLYRLCSQSQWNYGKAKTELYEQDWRKDIVKILYRPFDTRWTIYNPNVAVHRRERVMNHMKGSNNLGIICPKRLETKEQWSNVFCSKEIVDHVAVSLKTIDYLFPLYLLPQKVEPKGQVFLFNEDKKARNPNFSSVFIKELEIKLGIPFLVDNTVDNTERSISPESVLYYIYSILYSPTYRTRYSEYLVIDFPRVPMTLDRKLFFRLASIGGNLMKIHNMDFQIDVAHNTAFAGNGSNYIESKYPIYQNNSIFINKEQNFSEVYDDVWSFRIGGYQVLQKWIKDRRGRQLSLEEITYYQKIIVAIQDTINLMIEIDEAIEEHGGWPIQ